MLSFCFSSVAAIAVIALLVTGAHSASTEDPDTETTNAARIEKLYEDLRAILPDDDAWQTTFAAADPQKVHDAKPALDPCKDFKGKFVCDDKGQITTFILRQPQGRVIWQALNPSVTTVEIMNSNLSYPFRLEEMPATVLQLKCVDVIAPIGSNGGGAVGTPQRARATLMHLRTLTMVRCDAAVKPEHLTTLESFEWLPSWRTAHLVQPPPLASLRSIRTLTLWNQDFTAGFDLSSMDATSLSLINCSLSHLLGTPSIGLREVNLAMNRFETAPPVLLELPGLTHLNLSYNSLTTLPELKSTTSVHTLDISYNYRLSAKHTFDFDMLPPRIVTFAAAHVGFSGVVDLKRAPRTLEHLDLEGNNLKGGLDLEQLPPHIAYFSVKSNALSGPLNLNVLPRSARFVFLQNNFFTGRPIAENLPRDLRRILWGNNSWTRVLPP